MKKLIFGTLAVFTFIFILCSLIVNNIQLRNQNHALVMTAIASDDENVSLKFRVDSLMNESGTKEIIYHARDPRTRDFLSFTKIGRGFRGYEILTDIPDIDRAAFDFIYWTCVDSGVDIPFLLHVLWSESRFGTNTKHAKNSDGSIDGGWFGINYKKGVAPMNRTPYTDVFDFIKKFRILQNFPRSEWASRYNSKALWLK